MADTDTNSSPDTSLFTRLKKLFSTDVIIRNVGGKKLKVIDSDSVQQLAQNRGSQKDRYNRLRTSTYHRDMNVSYQASRNEMYADFEVMDRDPILASALDIYSDECLTESEMGKILTIKSSDPNIQAILENLFEEVLNIDFNLWSWIRNLTKYGDFFLKIEVTPEYGVYQITPISVYEMERIEGLDEENKNYIRFKHTGGQSSGAEYENYEIAHFRLASDSNFIPYGKSMLEGARRVWKQLSLSEDAMLIHRIMRAPEKRIFKLDIGNIPPNEVDAFIEKMSNQMKKTPYIDPRTGDYNLRFNLQNMVEDFFLPVRGGDSGTSIDTLSGMEFTGIEDIDYLKNKMMAALKIPRAFLGYEEALSGKSTLASEDLRFSKTITRIQKIVLSELRKIAIIHLYSQGFEDAMVVDFELSLTNPSTIYEQEKIAILTDKMNVAKDMLDSKMFSKKWVFKHIFDISDNDLININKEVLADVKQTFRFNAIENDGKDPATDPMDDAEGIGGDDMGDDMGGGMGGSGGSEPPTDDDMGGEPDAGDDGGAQGEPPSDGPNESRIPGSSPEAKRKRAYPFGEDPLGKLDLEKAGTNRRKTRINPIKHAFKNKKPLSIRDSLNLKYGLGKIKGQNTSLLSENNIMDEV